MKTSETGKLCQFFGLQGAQECRLYLPTFSEPTKLETVPTGVNTAGTTRRKRTFRYPGRTFADRDAKAASYVSSVLSRAVDIDHIQWEDVKAFSPGQAGTVFLFGSRSNQAAKWATQEEALGKFFRFKFGSTWSIQCAGNRKFSLPAVNELSRDEYEKKTDYGVIGRFRDMSAGACVFLIAGLGSRATEGCGYYLAHFWAKLARTFQGKDFAFVLKFPPPIEPKKSEEVIAFDSDHVAGFLPEC